MTISIRISDCSYRYPSTALQIEDKLFNFLFHNYTFNSVTFTKCLSGYTFLDALGCICLLYL